MSQFAFLQTEWPDLHDAASKAEFLVYSDARAACFYARRNGGTLSPVKRASFASARNGV